MLRNVGLAVGVITALAAPGCSHPAAPATVVVHLVAVDQHGQPYTDYREQPSGPTVTTVSDCAASPAAVSADIYQCWPSAAGADACWAAENSRPAALLCLDDPWSRRLHRVTVDSELLGVQPAASPQPLALLLDDGTRCRRRNGGAWGGRDDGYVGAYGCESPTLTVLVKPDDSVIDRGAPLWTVKVGELGAGAPHLPPPQTRTVQTAWFVGDPG